jgi:hypothetical protein
MEATAFAGRLYPDTVHLNDRDATSSRGCGIDEAFTEKPPPKCLADRCWFPHRYVRGILSER